MTVGALSGMAALIGLSAFFSSSETALFSLDRATLRELRERGTRRARGVLRLLEHPRDLLLGILFANLSVNTAYFALAEMAVSPLGTTGAAMLRLAAIAGLIVAGEVVPKSLAVAHPRFLARWASLPLEAYLRVVLPILGPLRWIVSILLRRWSKWVPSDPFITTEELESLVTESHEAGVIDSREHELLQVVVKAGQIKVRQVMMPRVELRAWDVDGSTEELKAALAEWKVARVFLYENEPDQIVGFLRARDVMLGEPVPLRGLCQSVSFCSENATLDQALGQIVEEGRSVAIALDEYGGTAGMITMTGVLERIYGEFGGPAPGKDSEVKKLGEDRWEIDGRLAVIEWATVCQRAFPEAAVDTVGGFVTQLLDRIPEAGDQIDHDGLRYTVLDIDQRRVGRLLVEPSS
ncbi:MAG: hemolysin family protein [Planctomycetota bacterium]